MSEETSPLLENAHDEPQNHGSITARNNGTTSSETAGENGIEGGKSTANLISIVSFLLVSLMC